MERQKGGRAKRSGQISEARSYNTNLCWVPSFPAAGSFGFCCVHGCWLPALLALSPINAKTLLCWRFDLYQREAVNMAEQRAV